MKVLFLATALAIGVSASAPALAQAMPDTSSLPADELAEARQIIQASFPDAEQDAIFRKMVDTLGGQFAASLGDDPIFKEPGIKAIMADFFARLPGTLMPTIRRHMPAILEATAAAYVREFSLDELRQIRSFAATPAGAHYFRKSTELLSDPAVAAANQSYFKDLQALQQSVREEIKAKVIAYLEANPEALERLSAGQ